MIYANILLGITLFGHNIEPSTPPYLQLYKAAPAQIYQLDWRDRTDINVRSQGDCGACVAFALASTLDIQREISCGRKTISSPQAIMACIPAPCKHGVRLSEAVSFITDKGLVEEDCFPYEGVDLECRQGCSFTHKNFKVKEPTRGFIQLENIIEALQRGPLLTSIVLYDDLVSFKEGVYSPKPFARKIGSHAVVITGYDYVSETFTLLNSWGDQWGDKGFFQVRWNDTKLLAGRYTYSFEVNCD
jgi:C1A family cysteine protease